MSASKVSPVFVDNIPTSGSQSTTSIPKNNSTGLAGPFFAQRKSLQLLAIVKGGSKAETSLLKHRVRVVFTGSRCCWTYKPVIGGLVFEKHGASFPTSGGILHYLRQAFGRIFGILLILENAPLDIHNSSNSSGHSQMRQGHASHLVEYQCQLRFLSSRPTPRQLWPQVLSRYLYEMPLSSQGNCSAETAQSSTDNGDIERCGSRHDQAWGQSTGTFA
ncbi:hypothetical protein C8F04DRAFT_39564 [Mycena alexandri]|uniref:Uncharacterized protein n=1 Tax=Mycena alexandri TaxID=1745969 RepID=A0AAD6SLX7_9AGAR|nr:hypothetical protein C8F04DRAFT_39564 [Mycena alexandri]